MTTSYDDSNFWNRLQLTVEQLIGAKKEISLNSSNSSSRMSSKSQTSKTKSKDNDLYKNQLSTEDRLALKKMVSIDPNLGTVVVTAFPSELDTVEKYISTLQSLANKQVVIEAKILDVTLNKDHKEGLDLNLPNYKLKPNIFPETSSTETFAFMGNGVMPEEISLFH